MNLPRKLFAKALTAFGTNSVVVVIADDDPHRRLMTVSLQAIDILRRLIAAGGRGVAVATLSPSEIRASHHDLETKLSIRVRRTRTAGFVILANTVAIVDQRTSEAEAA